MCDDMLDDDRLPENAPEPEYVPCPQKDCEGQGLITVYHPGTVEALCMVCGWTWEEEDEPGSAELVFATVIDTVDWSDDVDWLKGEPGDE